MHFQSLPHQVADHLKAEIARGRWQEFLPGERAIADTLHVSRRTVSAAVQLLQRDGVLRSEPARGHRITVPPAAPAATHLRPVGLLTPEPLEAMRPGATLWVNELRVLLAEVGWQIEFFHGHKYVTRQPARALEKLVRTNPRTCWLLAGMSGSAQLWFEQRKIPAVVAGTRPPGASLPDVDLDFHALGRHVGARLVTHGHRRVALFLTRAPGYLTSEALCDRALREVFRKTYGGADDLLTVYHERTRDGLLRALRRVFAVRERPTAIVMTNSLDYLTATSFLAQSGLSVPRDVSVIARNDDTFMRALTPEPTRYHADPHAIARKVFRLLTQAIEGTLPPEARARIMPDFIEGGSLARAHAPGAGG